MNGKDPFDFEEGKNTWVYKMNEMNISGRKQARKILDDSLIAYTKKMRELAYQRAHMHLDRSMPANLKLGFHHHECDPGANRGWDSPPRSTERAPATGRLMSRVSEMRTRSVVSQRADLDLKSRQTIEQHEDSAFPSASSAIHELDDESALLTNVFSSTNSTCHSADSGIADNDDLDSYITSPGVAIEPFPGFDCRNMDLFWQPAVTAIAVKHEFKRRPTGLPPGPKRKRKPNTTRKRAPVYVDVYKPGVPTRRFLWSEAWKAEVRRSERSSRPYPAASDLPPIQSKRRRHRVLPPILKPDYHIDGPIDGPICVSYEQLEAIAKAVPKQDIAAKQDSAKPVVKDVDFYKKRFKAMMLEQKRKQKKAETDEKEHTDTTTSSAESAPIATEPEKDTKKGKTVKFVDDWDSESETEATAPQSSVGFFATTPASLDDDEAAREMYAVLNELSSRKRESGNGSPTVVEDPDLPLPNGGLSTIAED